MGVLPLQFLGSDSAQTLKLVGNETFDIEGLEGGVKPQQDATLVIHRTSGKPERVKVRVAHRHADRGRVLQARRHSAVCAAAVARGMNKASRRKALRIGMQTAEMMFAVPQVVSHRLGSHPGRWQGHHCPRPTRISADGQQRNLRRSESRGRKWPADGESKSANGSSVGSGVDRSIGFLRASLRVARWRGRRRRLRGLR